MQPKASYLVSRAAFFLALLGGCSSTATVEDESTDEALAQGGKFELSLTVAESKETFSSRVERFGAVVTQGSRQTQLPCRERAFGLMSKESLYGGWSPDRAAAFADDVAGAKFHDYTYASCRDANTEAFVWFSRDRDIAMLISDELLEDDYSESKMPLVVELQTIGKADRSTFACAARTKTPVGETAHEKTFDMRIACKKRPALSAAERGPIDFVARPGAWGAVASYKSWALPSVPATQASLTRVKTALLKMVEGGSYDGVMSTLSKGCAVKVSSVEDELTIEHTIVGSTPRTRTLKLQTANLLGFVEGDVFADPIRIQGPAIGKYAAAEFLDAKGKPVVVRFEKNTSKEGQIVRINGSEAYCRRLQKNGS